MSKLMELLEKVGQQPSTPMGFGSATRRVDEHPAMVLVGSVTPEQLARRPDLVEAKVDAVLVSVDDLVEDTVAEIAGLLEGRLWGARLCGVDKAQATMLREKGCDFILFHPEHTAAAVLCEEDIGKLFAIESNLSEELARAIHDLPFDAVVFSPDGEFAPLTVHKVIEYQAIRGLVAKPFLMTALAALTSAELEPLRAMGVAGLVVDLTSPDDIASTRDAIGQLPQPRHRAPGRLALIPQVPVESSRDLHETPDDDEDGDF